MIMIMIMVTDKGVKDLRRPILTKCFKLFSRLDTLLGNLVHRVNACSAPNVSQVVFETL